MINYANYVNKSTCYVWSINFHLNIRGKDTAIAYARDDAICPHEIGHVWKFSNGTTWADAREGLIVKCVWDIELPCPKFRKNLRQWHFPNGFGLTSLQTFLKETSSPNDKVPEIL